MPGRPGVRAVDGADVGVRHQPGVDVSGLWLGTTGTRAGAALGQVPVGGVVLRHDGPVVRVVAVQVEVADAVLVEGTAAVVVRTPEEHQVIGRYNPEAVVCVGIPFGHTRPQWILSQGGAITVDGMERRTFADYR